MKIKWMKYIAIASLPIFLAGCATDSSKLVNLNLHYVSTSSVPVTSRDINAQAQLSEAAASTTHSLQQMSSIDMATHPKSKLGNPLNARAIGMGQIASLNWNGPAQPVLKRLAAVSHYRFRVVGTRPAIPVLISMNASHQSVYQMLRDVQYQIEKKARVKIYPGSRIVELRYLNNQ